MKVEVWSEKGTVQGILAPELNAYGVTFRVMRGFGSFTVVRQAGEDANDLIEAADKPTIVLYVGDWDQGGLYMSEEDLPARIERYVLRLGALRAASSGFDMPKLTARVCG